MDWQSYYKSKLVTSEEAVKVVNSGDTVSTGLCLGGASRLLLDALINRHDELEGVVITDAAGIWPTKLYDTEYMKAIDGKMNFITPYSLIHARKILGAQCADFLPCTAGDVAWKILDRANIFMIMVSPPNKEGYVNLGLSNFMSRDIIRYRDKSGIRAVIAEVNDQVPIVYGDNWIHVSEIDYFVENSTPMFVFKRGAPSEQEQAIAKNVLDIINDGDTIQIGFGGVSEAVSAGLDTKKDLNIFTELLPATLPDLIRKGIVTNRTNSFKKGVTVGSFGFGDEAFYDFVNNNPLVELYPSSQVVNPILIAQQPNMVAINNALLIDLSGQICSEGLGHRQISGSGGQPDFQVGAYHAKNGRACTLLTSARTLSDGSIASSIVADLPAGTPVTVARNFADIVITEYGVARLRNKSRRERAEALIAIAHPSLRDELKFQAKKIF